MPLPSPYYRWRPHPWHGLDTGPNPPEVVCAYVEITPFDLMKYEIDKETGYLRVDRPQRTSSQPPTLYGFIPRTFCGPRVGALMEKAGSGDGDPLDVCVLSERPIARAEVVLNARVVGGLAMVDGGEADDKIVAVLANDSLWDDARDVRDIPAVLVERLRHYFSTYKAVPGKPNDTSIEGVYGRDHAFRVISASIEDYSDEYGE